MILQQSLQRDCPSQEKVCLALNGNLWLARPRCFLSSSAGMASTSLLFMFILRPHHICKCISHIYFPQIFPSETTKQPETVPWHKSHAQGVTSWFQPGYNRGTMHQCDAASRRKFSLWELWAQNWYSHRDNHKLLLLSSCITTSSAAAHPHISTQKQPQARWVS